VARLRTFVRDAALYSVAQWLQRALGFLLIPIYTRVFSTADYGVLDLAAATVAFVAYLLQLGLKHAVTRYFNDSDDDEIRRAWFATALWAKVATYGPVAILLGFAARPIAAGLLGDESWTGLIRVALLSVATTGLWDYFLQLERMRFRARAYALLSISHLLLSLGLTLLLVLVYERGVAGIYEARATVDALMLAVVATRNRAWIVPPARGRIGPLLAFGLPFLPNAVAYYVIEFSDRYILQWIRGPEELGLYAIAYKLASILNLVGQGFAVAWDPYLWSVYRDPQGPARIRLVFQGFSVLLVIGATMIGALGPEVLAVVTPESFHAGAAFAPPLLAGVAFFFATTYFCVGIGVERRTIHRTWAGLTAAVVNISLNVLWIPGWGAHGAAAATLAAYLVYGLWVMRAAERLYPLGLQVGRLAAALLAGIGVAWIAHRWEPAWASSLVKVPVVAVIALALPFATGLLKPGEARMVADRMVALVRERRRV
jgi:O-antigen/teichoic acid export membrane protein